MVRPGRRPSLYKRRGACRVSIDELVECAQAVLEGGGFKTAFTRSHDVAMYRYEGPDRQIEVVVRPDQWSVWCTHVASGKSLRTKGKDLAGLEKALGPWCDEVAFEPVTGHPSRFS